MTCADGYGDVVELKIGTRTYLLNNPEDIRHVLETYNQNYDKTPRLTSWRGRRFSGSGLLTTLSGAPHLRQRQILQPIFHRSTAAEFAQTMVSCTEQMLAAWERGVVLDISVEMMRLVQRIMGHVLLGLDLAGDAEELGQAIRTRRRYLQYIFGSLFPLPEYLPNRINRDYAKAIALIDQTLYSMIRSRRAFSASHPDMLSMLIQARYRDGAGMTDKEVRDEALTISITGTETLGDGLAWTWYLLARHPGVAARLRSELTDVLGGRVPTVEDVPRLRYTEMVLNESMRLYPPTWIFVRIARKADVLPSGTRIPGGSKLYLCPFVVHRNPSYFPDPGRFEPERFLDDAQKSRPKFSYFPFGGGPRVCIGQALAKIEGMLILASIAQRFQLTLVPGQSVAPDPGITLRPKDGILMRVTRR